MTLPRVLLYALFLAAHFRDIAASPALCAVDNADLGLNPRLAQVTLIAHLCKWYSGRGTPRRQIIVDHAQSARFGWTTYLQDDRVRLFTVSRTSSGRTSVRRVEVNDWSARSKRKQGWSLSRLWVMGHLGGVPRCLTPYVSLLPSRGQRTKLCVHAVLECLLANTDFEFHTLQPEGSVAFESAPLGGTGTGWGGVYQWARQSAAEGGGSVSGSSALSYHELLIVQVDADIAGKSYSSAGIDHPPFQDLPCKKPCPPPDRTTNELRTVILGWLGEAGMPTTSYPLHAVEKH